MRDNVKIVENQLRPWVEPIDQIFNRYSEFVEDDYADELHRIFIDRGGKVLFVAHLDTVQTPKIRGSKSGLISGQGFDDRLGCMLAYDLSEELEADLLLTDHEEVGLTTAVYHQVKDYNWIVEFDREGTDVVTYGLDSPEFRRQLNNFWRIGYGSFSDICDLRLMSGSNRWESRSRRS